MKLSSITHGTRIRPPRIILLGEPKLGKSTWASQSKNPVFIPVKGEEGIDALDVDKFPVAGTFDEVLDDLAALKAEESGYKTVVIDSSSALEPLVWSKVVEEYGKDGKKKSIEDFGYAKGYIFALGYWRALAASLDTLRDKGFTSIIIGHARSKTVTLPDADPYDSWVWDIHEKAANLFYRWADFVGFAGRLITVKQGDRKDEATDMGRWLFTQRTAVHPCGGRGVYGQLPERIRLDFNAFREAASAVRKAQQNQNQNKD